jgi:hypothetical protein
LDHTFTISLFHFEFWKQKRKITLTHQQNLSISTPKFYEKFWKWYHNLFIRKQFHILFLYAPVNKKMTFLDSNILNLWLSPTTIVCNIGFFSRHWLSLSRVFCNTLTCWPKDVVGRNANVLHAGSLRFFLYFLHGPPVSIVGC